MSLNVDDWQRVLTALKENKKHGAFWSSRLDSFADITYDEAKTYDSKSYTNCAHGFIWAKNDAKLWDKVDPRAAVLMQMRFDGYIGFPGGIVDDTDESWEFGLNRELEEEMNITSDVLKFEKSDYLFSTVYKESKYILHFYGKEISLSEFETMEKRAIDSHDYGGEVMGLIRPVLYELENNRGFPVFLKNQFVGNSLFQLLRALLLYRIINVDEMIELVGKCD